MMFAGQAAGALPLVQSLAHDGAKGVLHQVIISDEILGHRQTPRVKMSSGVTHSAPHGPVNGFSIWRENA